MKTIALALAFAASLGAISAHAEQAPVAQPAAQPSQTASAEAPLGRDGQDTRQFCSAQNPNIQYRDCVNASTRDPNAKVRLG